MDVTREDVLRCAKLAHLSLQEEEVEPMRRAMEQLLTQARVIEGQAVDRHADVALVVTKAFQHGLEALEIAAGTADEAEWAHGSGLAQGLQLRGGFQCRVQCTVASRSHVDFVGLRIGCTGERRPVEQHDSDQQQYAGPVTHLRAGAMRRCPISC